MVATGFFVPNLVEIGRSVLTSFNYLVKSVFSSAAILDFKKFHFEASQCLGGSKMNLQLKFYGNRTTGFEFIQVFVNLKIVPPPS